MKTTVNNTHEAVTELQKQLKEKDFNMHNYKLLSNLQAYLDQAKKIDDEYGNEFDEAEQIFNFLSDHTFFSEEENYPVEL